MTDDPLDEHPMNPINQEGYDEDFPHPDDEPQYEEELTTNAQKPLPTTN